MTKILWASIFCITLFSCSVKEEVVVENVQKKTVKSRIKTRASTSDGYDHLQNPYSISVMQSVYDTYSTDSVKINPTDVYLRIQPRDSSELDYLLNESGLEIFEYPLDIDLDDGEEYNDQSLSENDFPWLYTVIKYDYELDTSLKYELLDVCYIPKEGESIALTKSSSIDVEAEAYKMLGYEVDDEPDKFLAGAKKAYPKGRITVYDADNKKEMPVKGVRVRGHRFIKYSIGYTDENGYYELRSRFKHNLHYAIVFENVKGFALWGNYGPFAKAHCTVGKHSNTGYSKKITKENDPKLWRWAAVNNAGYDYYKMCAETGIKIPPPNLRIMVFPNVGRSSTPMMRHCRIDNSLWLSFFYNIGYLSLGPLVLPTALRLCCPDITIGAGGKKFEEIYNHTSHELSHASHFSQVGAKYWGHYIDYIITHGPYGDGKGMYAELCGIGEMWGYMMGVVQEYECYSWQLDDKFPYSAWDDWFKPHVFWTLYQKQVLTKRQIFDCLTSDVYSFDDLVSKMYSKYPYAVAAIEKAFIDNGVSISSSKNLNFVNQEVASSMEISGDSICAENVTVLGNATLLLSGKVIILRSPFIVDAGASLVLQNNISN